MHSRITLTLILVDETNNAAQFNRMQICSSGLFECDKNFDYVRINLIEEQDESSASFHLAKMNDFSKNEDDICYYLSGKFYFFLNKFNF